MQISYVGFLWIIMLACSAFAGIRWTAALSIISVIFEACFAVGFKGSAFSLADVSLLFLFSCFFINCSRRKIYINSMSKACLIFFVTVVAISLFDTVLFDGYRISTFTTFNGVNYYDGIYEIALDSQLIKDLAHFMLYMGGFCVLCSVFYECKEDELKKYFNFILFFSVISVLVIGAVQYLNAIGIVSANFFVELFHTDRSAWGGRTEYDAFYLNYDKLYSIFSEPSHCAPWLVGVFWGLVFSNYEMKHRKILLFALLTEIVFAFSSTGYLCFIFMFLIYLWKNVKNKNRLIKISICILLAVFFLFYFESGQRIVFELINKKNSSSGVGRLEYLILNYKTFFQTFFCGVGFQKINSMTLISGLLGQLGIGGFVAFILFLERLFVKNHYNNAMSVFAKVLLFEILISMIVSFSGFNYAKRFWFALYLFGCVYSAKYTSINDLEKQNDT